MPSKKKMKLVDYEDFRAGLLSPEELAEVDRLVAADLAKMAEDEKREAAKAPESEEKLD